jgi:hypothetical protein
MSDNFMEYEQGPEDDSAKIDYIAIVKTIWSGRRTVFICLSVGLILGVFVAISSTNVYTASTIMAPQLGNSSNKGSSLSGLAALAGINIDMMSSNQQGSDLSPILYPKIVSSVPFQLELMNSPVKFQDIAEPISLCDYYTNPSYMKISTLDIISKYTVGLPSLLIGIIKKKHEALKYSGDKSNKLIQLTDEQYIVSKILNDAVTLDVVAKEGYLTLTVEMPDALVAAQVAQNAQQLLQKYITNFKIKKAKSDLEFIQGRYNVVKAEADGYQYSAAVKSDRYKDLTSNVPQVETSRIQTKYNISNGVFMELAKQLEQAKIQVKKDTPVFTVVEPVTVPVEKTRPSKPMIVFLWIFLSGVVSLFIIFGKNVISNIKIKWAKHQLS